MTKKEKLEKEIFDVAYRWGRVGVVTDEKCATFQKHLKDYRHQTIKEAIKIVEDFEDEYGNEILPYALYPDDIARLKSCIKDLTYKQKINPCH